jgi:hypothetical protein
MIHSILKKFKAYSQSNSVNIEHTMDLSRMTQQHHRQRQHGIALLVVITAITVMSIVLIDFSKQSMLHLNEGTYIRDEMRANMLADTAFDMTRACLDRKSWGALGAFQSKVDLERLCNLLLGVFIRGQIDLPLGGLSVPLEGVEGIKIAGGTVEEIDFKSESSYIGLAGLICAPPNISSVKTQKKIQSSGVNSLSGFDPFNCPSRVATVRKLRSLFCDPSISHVFETEHADGQRYTRADVIGNLIDWVDLDDNRVDIDQYTWAIRAGAGEGEDSYYRDSEERYRSKDSMFDSVEELRMVRGINDELYLFLRDRVSVYATDKVNMNTATTEVVTALLQANTQRFQMTEAAACGEESPSADFGRQLFSQYARMVIDARTTLQFNKMMGGNFLGQTFRTPAQFVRLAKDPLSQIVAGGLSGGTTLVNPLQILMGRYQMTEMQYKFIQTDVNWARFTQSLGNKDQLFRLTVRGKIGEMTRKITAVLKQDGDQVRTLYYRED